MGSRGVTQAGPVLEVCPHFKHAPTRLPLAVSGWHFPTSPRGAKVDHYRVLGVPRGASLSEIRAAYLAAARRHHPDKAALFAEGGSAAALGPPSSSDPPASSGASDFPSVLAAWEALSDGAKRSAHDSALAAADGASGSAAVRPPPPISEELELTEMEAAPAKRFVHPCRCGDRFSVAFEQIERCIAESAVSRPPLRASAGAPTNYSGAPGGAAAAVEEEPSLVLSCPSCSLHIRVYVPADWAFPTAGTPPPPL